MDFWSRLENAITGTFSIAFRFLGYQNPLRTSLGLCLGLCMRLSVDILFISLESSGNNIDTSKFERVGIAGFLAMGVLIMYLPVIIRFMDPARDEVLDENLDKVFAALRKTFRDGNIDPLTQRRFYIQIAQAVVDKIKLKPEIEEEIEKLNKLAGKETDNK